MTIQWYADGTAKRFYEDIKLCLKEWADRQLPSYELSHIGIRNADEFNGSDEIVIKLHFNKIGKIKVRYDLNEYQCDLLKIVSKN